MSQSKGIDILAINEMKLDSTITVKAVKTMVGMVVVSPFTFEVILIFKSVLTSDRVILNVLLLRKPFLVSTWYRPPKSSPDLFTIFERVIDKIDAENLELYLLGDLNCDLLPDSVNANSSHLLNVMDIYGLTQLITEPTRVA